MLVPVFLLLWIVNRIPDLDHFTVLQRTVNFAVEMHNNICELDALPSILRLNADPTDMPLVTHPIIALF
jgi:hypothetical protein